MQKGLLYYIALGRGENGLILWSWRLSRKSKDKCGLHADYQVMWLCGWWWWKRLPRCLHRVLMEFRIFTCFLRPSLLPIPASFSGITFYWTLGPSQLLSSPCCCRKTSSASRPPLWHSLYFRCWGLLLLHFFYTSWSSPPSSRLKLLLISLIFVKLIWDFESSLALMKDDGAPSLWSQK